jgi:hypothetical protein
LLFSFRALSTVQISAPTTLVFLVGQSEQPFRISILPTGALMTDLQLLRTSSRAFPMGPSPDHNDNMILDWSNNNSPGGFGHPNCKGGNPSDVIIKEPSKNYPTGVVIRLSD